MITTNFDYESCIRASERVSWKLDEVFPADLKLDFSRRFLPSTIAGLESIDFLGDKERLTLNHISGNAYLYVFYFVEEYILASVVQHANAEMFGDAMALRALLRFAEEECKHQQLFRRFKDAFARDSGFPCGVIPNPQAVAEVILSKAPMAVALTTLHIELMTQQHYVEGFQEGDGALDPFFVSLLKNHWLEESQHAKIDALELQKLAAVATPEQIETAVDDYIAILHAFSGLLATQASLDVTTLEEAVGKTYSEEQRQAITASQTRAYRHTFIVLGVQNPMFVKYLEQFSAAGRGRVMAQVGALS
jgi:hypothetical protein